jgi:hypothetical protein
MRAFLDACVLYPTVLRELLTGSAAAGLFTPLWSAAVLEEWARAAGHRLGPAEEAGARAEIAALLHDWPGALVSPGADLGLVLPDPDDIHVLNAACGAGCEVIVTFNLRDFPPRVLARAGIKALDPDRFLCAFGPPVLPVVQAVHGRAERIAGAPMDLRALMKRAKLPRLGRLAAPGGASRGGS